MKFYKYLQSDVVMEHINFIAKDKTKDWHKSVFSLNFSSAGKGPFMASKAENVHWSEAHFPRRRRTVEWGTWLRSRWEI